MREKTKETYGKAISLTCALYVAFGEAKKKLKVPLIWTDGRSVGQSIDGEGTAKEVGAATM